MRCLGEFHNDRTCDMCKKIDAKTYIECVELRAEEQEKIRKLTLIANRCPYRRSAIEDYQPYWECSIDGGDCDVELSCGKYVGLK